MEKRILSKFEEHIIRLIHHEFGGASIKDAADKVGLSPGEVKQILRDIKKKAPQLFPILTPQHQAILLMYDKHMDQASIATALGISKRSLIRKIVFLQKHNFLWNRNMDQYEPLMDSRVKEKF